MATKKSSRSHNKVWLYAAITALIVLLTAAVVWAIVERNNADRLRRGNTVTNGQTTDVTAALDEHGITPLTNNQASNNSQTAADLTFIVEEEKLAHDVYQAMYDKWDARVFGNIKNSETMHQNLVLSVMQSRGLKDPRSDKAGVFTNQELQKLYDQMIAQGSKSVSEAYNVGVTIEERDIADLKDMIARLDAKDTDVKAVLENLLSGSENHLRAFSRQANR